jgi:hypothetical protein
MKWLIALIFPIFSFAQEIDTCFTVNELEDISFTIDSLYYLDSVNSEIIINQKDIIKELETIIKLDSITLSYTNTQNDILQNNILYLRKQIDYIQPKWYDNKALYFIGGIITTAITSKFIIEVTK